MSDPSGGRLPAQCQHGIPTRSCTDCRGDQTVADRLMDAYADPDLIVYGGPEHMRPGYVYKPTTATEHTCDLPAEWIEGAVWRCRDGHLWVVDDACECRGRIELHRSRGSHMVGRAWHPAGWWLRRKHHGRKARPEMANENREQTSPRLKPPPPSTPSGVSPGPEGMR